MKTDDIVARRADMATRLGTIGSVGCHNIAAFAEEWGVSTSTAWADRRYVLARMEEESADQGDPAVSFMAQLDATIEAAGERNPKDAIPGLALKARVQGLEAAQRIEVEVAAAPLVDADDRALDKLLGLMARANAGELDAREARMLSDLGVLEEPAVILEHE